jgi:hypothetical protein
MTPEKPGTMFQPGAPGPKLRQPYRPVPAPPVQRSIVGKVIVLLVLGGAGFGGYYGYCKYKLGAAINDFDQYVAEDLHNWLMRRMRGIGPEDLRQFVVENAPGHGLTVQPTDIQATVEPYNDETAAKLPQIARAGLGMAFKIRGKRDETPALWVVGFRATLEARHGIARGTFVSEHYTWHEWVAR